MLFASLCYAAPAKISPWQRHAEREKEWRAQGLVLLPHQSNYFFPFTYNTSPHASSTNEAQYKEAKYQFSVKVLILDQVFHPYVHMYFGYTQLSFWQVYDRDRSAPFRDINHEPELFFTVDAERPLGPVYLRRWDVGIAHQSNGLTQPDSRSWNRIYGRFHFDFDEFAFGVKPWFVLPNSDRDNPDIAKFMGYGEMWASYYRKNHVWSLMIRNNMRFNGNRGAFQIDYSYPLTRILTGLMQFFSGYGESLLDYNRPSNRFSAGLALSQW